MISSDNVNATTDYRAAVGAAAGSFLLSVAGILSLYLLWTIKEAVEVLAR